MRRAKLVWWGLNFEGWGFGVYSWKGNSMWPFFSWSFCLGPVEIRVWHRDQSDEALQRRYHETRA